MRNVCRDIATELLATMLRLSFKLANTTCMQLNMKKMILTSIIYTSTAAVAARQEDDHFSTTTT